MQNRSPTWFRIVAILALLWNCFGIAAFLMEFRITPEELAQLSEGQRTLYEARPAWASWATGVAVFGGLLGCIGLLIGRRWAVMMLVASLLGLLVQDFGIFVLMRGLSLAGTAALITQGLVLAIGIALVWLALHASRRGWLR